MNNKITVNGLASIVLSSYGHDEAGAWDFKTQRAVEAGDGLLTFLLSETASASHCDTAFESLVEAARLIESAAQDVEATLSRINLYIVNALAANYLEWFLEHGHQTDALLQAVDTWSYTLKGHVRDAYSHAVVPKLEQLAAVSSTPYMDPVVLPQLMLQNLKQQLTIGSEFLPEGGNAEPLYACEISSPAEDVCTLPPSADGQAVTQPSVPGSPTPGQ